MISRTKQRFCENSSYNASITRELFLFYEVRTTENWSAGDWIMNKLLNRSFKIKCFNIQPREVRKMALTCLRRLDTMEDQTLVEAIVE